MLDHIIQWRNRKSRSGGQSSPLSEYKRKILASKSVVKLVVTQKVRDRKKNTRIVYSQRTEQQKASFHFQWPIIALIRARKENTRCEISYQERAFRARGSAGAGLDNWVRAYLFICYVEILYKKLSLECLNVKLKTICIGSSFPIKDNPRAMFLLLDWPAVPSLFRLSWVQPNFTNKTDRRNLSWIRILASLTVEIWCCLAQSWVRWCRYVPTLCAVERTRNFKEPVLLLKTTWWIITNLPKKWPWLPRRSTRG